MLTLWVVVVTVAPLAVWAAIYAALKQNLFPAESMLHVLRAWRWIAWTGTRPRLCISSTVR